MVKWSSSQKNVIDLVRGDLLVSASAGSGKTAVLVERILNLILNYGVSIDEILIITFTNAAACEMSERILKVLESNLNSTNRDILEEQMFLINNANIQTFHAFCLEILKNNYYRLNLNSNLKILKESNRKILINECLEEVFNLYYEENDSEFIKLVNAYGGKYSDDHLKEIVISIYNFVGNQPNIFEFQKMILENYTLRNEDEIFNTTWGRFIKKEYESEVNSFKKILEELTSEHFLDDKQVKNISDDLKIVNNFISSLEEGYEAFRKFLNEVEFSRISTKFKEEYDSYKDERESFKKFLRSLKNEIFYESSDVVKEIMYNSFLNVKKIFEISNRFREVFQNKKSSNAYIDFNDMEHLTIKLFEDDKLCDEFKNKFKYIFIDEYQDTNYIQEYLINKIKRMNDKNVFMVGDIKQSIYSFRGAKVDLFHNKYKTFNKVYSLNDNLCSENKILLYDNYRSRREVIDFINFIFKNVMVESVSNIEYTEEEYLNYKGSYEDFENDEEDYLGEIKLGIVIEDEGVDEEEEDEKILNEDVCENECKLVVNYIKDLINGNKTHKIFDKELNSYRKIEYRDIVILMRNVRASSKSSILEEELLKNNIPVYFDGGETFFDSIEVMVVISLLKVIDNPLNDIDILTLIRSEIFNFSENELSYLRIVNRNDYLYNNIIKICGDYESVEGKIYLSEDFYLHDNEFLEFKRKCDKFIDSINLYRNKSLFMKIDEFIWYLYIHTNYYFYVSTMEEGVKKQNNLRLIFNKAKDFRISNSTGIFNFLEYLENSKKSGDDVSVPKNISKNENVVRIMSIHKSKGLEFPVVILCNTSNLFNKRNINSNLVLDDMFGIALNFVDYEKNLESEPLIKQAIKLRLKKNMVSEELRILYVALTRAKEKLFITGTYKTKKIFKRIYNLNKCNCYLDFICNALMKHEKGIYFRENSSREDFKFIDRSNLKLQIEIFSIDDFKNDLDEKLNSISFEDFKENLNRECKFNKEIYDVLNFQYEFKESLNSPINLSVSQIISGNNERKINVSFKQPKFLNENNEKVYSSLDIGNLYHLIMQNINLKNEIDFEYINSEINGMIQKGILKNDDLKYISVSKIESFFKNNLGLRLMNSIKNGEIVKREFEFLMKHRINEICESEDIRIQGIIDLFFFEGDNIILVDYKTDKMIFSDDNKFLNKYKEQLHYYKLALEKIFNKKVSESYIYSFELSKEIII